jgi:hypothetical protein
MLPKTHAIIGLVFSILIYILFKINVIDALLIFLSSIFIDVDHYLLFAIRNKDFSLKNAYKTQKNSYLEHKKNKTKTITEKKILHVFHTLEFFIFILILSYFWNIFFFVFLGMLIHTIFDMIEMFHDKNFNAREYFLIRYLLSDKNKYL